MLAEHAGQLSSLCLQGDVYHILFNLGEWLDGRVWPRKDQLEVLRLMDLIHHVTGLLLLLPLCLLALLPSGDCYVRHGSKAQSARMNKAPDGCLSQPLTESCTVTCPAQLGAVQ